MSGSASAHTTGAIEQFDPRHAKAITVVNVGANTETNLLTLRNKHIYGGVQNHTAVRFLRLSMVTDSSKGSLIRLYTGGTIGANTLADHTDYSDVDTNDSAMSIDTSAITITGGSLGTIFALEKTDSQIIDLKASNSQLFESETATITIQTSNATNETIVALTWFEDQ